VRIGGGKHGRAAGDLPEEMGSKKVTEKKKKKEGSPKGEEGRNQKLGTLSVEGGRGPEARKITIASSFKDTSLQTKG